MTKPLSRAERQREELRREIIDAAFALFGERGYHATGVADIAARVGIGHGTFYRYFENKRQILDRVVDDLVTRIMTVLALDPSDAAGTLQEYRSHMARLADGLSEVFFADPRIPRLLLLESTGVDAALTARMFRLLESMVSLTAEVLAHGVKQGFVHADLDVEHTARAINGMALMSALYGATDESGPEHMRRLNAAILRIMFDGIRKQT